MASEADESISGHSDHEAVFDNLEENGGDDSGDSDGSEDSVGDDSEIDEDDEHIHCKREIKVLSITLKEALKYKSLYEEQKKRVEKLEQKLENQLRDRRKTLHTERVG